MFHLAKPDIFCLKPKIFNSLIRIILFRRVISYMGLGPSCCMWPKHHCSPAASIPAFFALSFPPARGTVLYSQNHLQTHQRPVLHKWLNIKQFKYHVVNTKYYFSVKLRHSWSKILTAQNIASCQASCCFGHIWSAHSSNRSLGPVYSFV